MLGLFIYIYMIIGNSEVLSGIINEDKKATLMPLSIGIIGFTYPYRRILFDNHRYFLLTIIPVILLYLTLNLIFSSQNSYSTLGEFAVIGLFLTMQAVESHYVENRTIQLFYRMEKEVESYATVDCKSPGSGDKTTKDLLSDTIISKCEFIVKELKYASSVIIFKDIKDRLKLAQAEAKNVIGQLLTFNSSVKLELPSQDIDEQDREFISQNYLSIPSPIRHNSTKMTTPVEFKIESHMFYTKGLLNDVNDKLLRIGQE